jgi:DNA-binding CsgD family transcriptional regulator
MQSPEQTNKQTNPVFSFEEACCYYLTDTEIRVVKLAALGIPSRVIAQKLGNKPSTIQTHRRNIKKKLGLNCTGALKRGAGRTGRPFCDMR